VSIPCLYVHPVRMVVRLPVVGQKVVQFAGQPVVRQAAQVGDVHAVGQLAVRHSARLAA